MTGPADAGAGIAALAVPPRVVREERADGTILLRNPLALPPGARTVGDWLHRWGREAPSRVFLAERPAPGADWLRLTWGEALTSARAIAAALLDRGLSEARPLAILSDNSIDHALLTLGGMLAGVPVATVSPAYSLLSQDRAKLRAMIGLLDPGLIYVADAARYSAALDAIAGLHRAEIVASAGAQGAVRAFAALLDGGDSAVADRAFGRLGPDTIARLLFTSGSTGMPKAVITTQRMLTTNQAAKAALWPFLGREPPVVLDWLPWSHTFGASHNFNLVLANGGTLWIDGGRPVPALIGITAANLAEIGPPLVFNVPRAYDMLVETMRRDPAFRDRFFGSARLVFYAGAALPQNLWEALDALSLAATGRPAPLVSGWGSTETAPLATDCHFRAAQSGNIGLPVPGTELKLVPAGGRLEVRVRGPNVTPGYWKAPELTRAAFDEEGFYRIGDALRFADPARPAAGLVFDGRIAEDFKLASGTWVNAGELRLRGVAALDPVAQDIVVTGHDGDAPGFLVFPNLAACRRLAGLDDAAPVAAVLAHPAVRAHVAKGLARLRDEGGGSSRHAAGAMLLVEPPSVDAGEITDKGYLNQRAALTRRQAEVLLLSEGAAPGVIRPEAPDHAG